MRVTLFVVLVVGCTEPRVGEGSQDLVEATDAGSGPDAPSLGMCGANRDPVIGTVCTYRYTGPTGPGELVGHEIQPGGEGFSDRVICTWRIPCQGALDSRTSPDGDPCLTVIGSGCPPPWERTAVLTRAFILPDGMTSGQVAAFCQSNSPHGSFAGHACSTLDDRIVLHEDYCCVKRRVDELLDTFGLHPWTTPRP